MTPPDTRSNALSDRDIAIIERLLAGRGASVNVSDPRLTQLQSWLIGLVGSGVIGGLLLLTTAVLDLRTEVAKWHARWEMVMDHEQRIRHLERRP